MSFWNSFYYIWLGGNVVFLSVFRMGVMCEKIITFMKRIGNQVENIVGLATNLDSTYSENYLSIGRMAESTIRMVKLSIQAFVNKDLEMQKKQNFTMTS